MSDEPEIAVTMTGVILPLDATDAAVAVPLAEMPPVDEPLPDPLPDPVAHAVSAFGATLVLDVPVDNFLVTDSEWRLENIYQPFLTTQMLPASGVALDIGAGYGSFGLLFAKAFPGWNRRCLMGWKRQV